MHNKKIFFIVALFIFSFFLSRNVFAEQINDFSSSIKINADASINVSEKIAYDFGDTEHHGIYRDIPIKYQRNGMHYNLRISQISVTDENGESQQFAISHIANNIRIKIGDPDSTISGPHTYIINYTIQRAINYFSDHDELYWNATGNGWTVDIAQAEAAIGFYTAIDKNNLTGDCYFGRLGSQDKCSVTSSDSQLSFSSSGLSGGDGMTIVAGFPKGLVAEPTAFGNFIYAIEDNWIIGLPILILILMFFIWFKFGRDPRDSHPVVAQYDVPDNLTPIEVGTLIDTRADNKDLSAEIIYLAINGYIKIIQQDGVKILGANFGKDYLLQRLKESTFLEKDFDKKLLDALISPTDKERKLSEIKMDTTAASKFSDVKTAVYKKLDKDGYFKAKSRLMKIIFSVIGFFVIAGGIFSMISNSDASLMVSLIISGLIIVIFAQFMCQRTLKGVEVENYLKGLKLYLGVVEKDRLDFHNAPEKNPQTFEKFLPYAMVLGVEKAWAGQFEGIYKEQPSWYSSPMGNSFSVIAMTNGLHSFSSSANMSMAASAQGGSSGMGGGGFSGGGFGGGGGGSW
jgi:uncharacterized membrane protein